MTAFAPRELAFANESTFGDSTAMPLEISFSASGRVK